MKCETCGNEHEGTYCSGRFCSSKCAHGFGGLKSKGSSKKHKFLKPRIERNCIICDKIFITKPSRPNQKCCSNKCASKLRLLDHNFVEKIKATKILHNSNAGWQIRYKQKRSYAEQFIERVLKNEGLLDKAQIEYRVQKKSLGLNCHSNYFLDFYFPDKKIDLEIDGKQHDYPERLEPDRIRDEALKNNGYKVYRIKWKPINDDEGKTYIKNEIDKFLIFYKEQL